MDDVRSWSAKPAWRGYALAVAAPVVAHFVRSALQPWLAPPFILFYPVVMLVALQCGRGPGLVATALASALTLVFVLPASGPQTAPGVGFAVAAFSGVCVAVSLLSGRFRELQERVARSEAERDFRALFDQAGVGMAETDLETGRFVRVNDRLCELLGYRREELLALRIQDVTHADDLASAREGVARMRERREPFRTAKRYVCKDGAVRSVRLTAAPLGAPGVTARRAVAVIEDETELRALGDQLRQAQKLESVGRLAGGVAHDFNNLLTVILGCVEVARQDRAEGQAVSPEDLDEIRGAALRARDLTRQLLNFARKGLVDPVPLDLSGIVRDAEKLLRRALGEDFELALDLEPAPWTVVADRGQLEQVLVNLAVNGRDAMESGGRVAVSVRNVGAEDAGRRSPLLSGREWVALAVRDTGSGMSDAVKAHLFEPFFTTKPVGKGTGLGLASVHGIATQAGGHVLVESDEGKGTTVEVFLPRGQGRADGGAHGGGAAELRGREVVLVVEDDAAVRAVTTRTLERAGYRVLQAVDGAEALEAARAHPEVRAVVTDVVMPGMPLAEVVEGLRRTLPGVKVLYVSGYPNDVLGERGIAAARDELLSKPFPPDALLARLRHLLDAPPDGGAEGAGAARAR
ncbi:MAG: PAS domain S-box protein [Anaeromyxobacter sp.]